MNLHVRTGDTVIVLSGRDKGRTGKVLETMPDEGKVIVEKIAVAKKHQKARRQTDVSGIIDKERPIYACKVMRVCPKCNKPTRLAHKVTENGVKVRVCKKCGAEI
ncbi:MAG: 50S ribosomal protein L24 [Clostridia bacterium]|nr:50S ribosomal protein L24 [Clostridia bacterium]